ncbi:uncharacterized protein LACBIDRAFT_335024 [Laccaria bicolor S238N-H82]|uniref:Predicted protein n=1 Tax=Laccaria bicolor (strain S238N-H82 / ATCC MYA-4686) TaxID=486041 RepID=B0E144_LACBS|nr:uncharacterized protein LACBIDRAFT_335024 [Laccaria bicolor S238N-H82]EDQ99448.1 predicted protein [Laccaria bicolor S238N-H82]|eukprot:XP_001889903.1 predicted protein [Laccaria bicolor S238N-H82]
MFTARNMKSIRRFNRFSIFSVLTASIEREESEPQTIFWDIDTAQNIPIWAEPIIKSTEHGIMPGSTKDESDRLRCAIELIYNTPKDLRWSNLGSAVRKFAEYEISKEDLVRHTGQSVTHGVERTLLLEASQVVVTVDQVLQTLAEFFHKRDREHFVLDQQFAFLRLIASHTSRTQVLATYRVLQYRTTVASKHLVQQINAITKMYGSDTDQMSVSSYESTRASLRSVFGSGSARKEAGKLLARPEYFSRMPQDLVETAAYLRDRAYKDRPIPKAFSIHRSRDAQPTDRPDSVSSRESMIPTTRPELVRIPAASESQGVRFDWWLPLLSIT